MPRKINALAVAAGKLILAIQKEEGEANDGRVVVSRAHTLQHAAHNNCVPALLNGRTVVEYLDAAWTEMHPAIKPSVEAFELQLSAAELSAKERL
jgi:hypothetical protein